MSSFESLSAEQHLLVTTPDGGERVAAEVYEFPAGIVYLDIGWCAPMRTWHPAHLIEGTLEGDGPWTIGNAVFRRIEPEEPAYLESLEWKEWARQMLAAGKTYVTREAGERFVVAEFGSNLNGVNK